MAAKDIYHDHVKTALEKDGWTITHDPYRLKWRGRKKMLIDLAAEKLLLAEKGASKIAIEVKSFVGTSEMEDLYNAIGQFFSIARRSGKPNLIASFTWRSAVIFMTICLTIRMKIRCSTKTASK